MSSKDSLGLASNADVHKMLRKIGDVGGETVEFSDFVVKINRKGKEQTRVLLITDKAVYNVLPTKYGNCKRRIPLAKILAVTVSDISEEFVIHVPDEYDYRMKSQAKTAIAEEIRRLKAGDSQRLRVRHTDDSKLQDRVLTKSEAKIMTREERRRFREELLQQESDDEEAPTQGNTSSGTPSGTSGAEDAFDMKLPPTEDKVSMEDFELLKVLGRGAFGKVMQVKKKSDGKIYAIKILKKQYIISRNQVEHTRAERKILQASQHPFLMHLKYAFQTPDKLYLVLNYYPGGELFFHLKNQRRFSSELARLWVMEIALALGHLHKLGYVYRDLKPENILLDAVGHVCLTDFGLSKDVEPDESAHTFCGTPEYLAPEIVSQQGHNKAVDWWSLGILLYELTVGIPPFYSQNVNEMYKKIQHGVLRFPPFLPEDCKSVIVKLLHRDPTQRLGSRNDVDEILAEPFFAVLDVESVMSKSVDVPFKPNVRGADDTRNFDETFTGEVAQDSVMPDSNLSSTQDRDAFQGFTFEPTNANLN